MIAVDPDMAMLRELREQVPDAAAIRGCAEDIPLTDRSTDAVLAAASFDCFDLEQAMPEIVRVLRPGGVFAALWNYHDDRVGWVSGFCDRTPASRSPTIASTRLSTAPSTRRKRTASPTYIAGTRRH